MASMWVKALVGGVLAAVVGKAIGEAMPVEPSTATAHPKSVLVDVEKQAAVQAPKPVVKNEPATDDYPLVRQAAAMSAKGDGLGLLLNLDGELCAEVISTRHLEGDSFEVVCHESRSGEGIARYRLNAATGKSARLS